MRFSNILWLRRSSRGNLDDQTFLEGITTPIKLPQGGKNGFKKKSSNNSHSTASKTYQASSSGEGTTPPSSSRGTPHHRWEQLEADLFERMSSSTDHGQNPLPLTPHRSRARSYTRWRRDTSMVQQRVIYADQENDPGFLARQKKWLQVTKNAIERSRKQKQKPQPIVEHQQPVVEHQQGGKMPQVEEGSEGAVRGTEKNKVEKEEEHEEKRCESSNEYIKEERMSGVLSDITSCHSESVADDVDEIENKNNVVATVPANVRDIVSYDDDMSATSIEVLMKWLGCYDSFDEDDYEPTEPKGMIILGHRSILRSGSWGSMSMNRRSKRRGAARNQQGNRRRPQKSAPWK